MSVFEDLFEKFDKGELREVEKVVNIDGTTDFSDPTKVTIDDLVDLEEVVAVEITTNTLDGDETYSSFVTGVSDTNLVGATGAVSTTDGEDNIADLTYYESSAGSLAAIDGTVTGSNNATAVKIVARGY